MVQDVALPFVADEVVYRVLGCLISQPLVLEQLVGYHEALVVSLLYRLLYLLVVGLDRKVHGLHLVVHLLVDLELVLPVEKDGVGHVSIDRHLDLQPGVVYYFVHADSFVGVDLQHSGYQVSGSWVERVGDRIDSF